MKTKAEAVTQTLYLWAIPHSEWHRENYPDDGLFKYEISDSSSQWRKGSVMLLEQEVTINVPEGIDLVEKAVETLKAEQVKVRNDAKAAVEDIQKQINNLLLLTHQDDSIVAEL